MYGSPYYEYGMASTGCDVFVYCYDSYNHPDYALFCGRSEWRDGTARCDRRHLFAARRLPPIRAPPAADGA